MTPASLDTAATFAEAYEWQRKGVYHRAIPAYHAIVTAEPGNASAWNNLGNCLRYTGQLEPSEACLRRATALSPRRDGYRLNLSLTLLARGQYHTAWPLFESRLGVIEHGADIRTAAPKWTGEPLAPNETLLIYGNQGLGDELQCLRYLPRVLERAPKVILEVQAPLRPLVEAIPGPFGIVSRGESRPPFHRQVEWFSLPGLFGTNPGTIPPPVAPDFEPDSGVVSELARLRRIHRGKKHIGLVWSGNPQNDLNPFRACGLDRLRPLLSLSGCHFHSLQVGPPRGDLAGGMPENLTDLAPFLTDFRATATAIRGLDLLITTDTSVPHLAGVLGAPAWLLLHEPADWRWQLDRDRTPWYPSLRLFRQARPRDWQSVIPTVKEELAAFCEAT